MNDETVSDSSPEPSNPRIRRLILAAALAISLALLILTRVAPPENAVADPSDDPCPLAMAFVCKFLPIAPELDDDVDLTKQAPTDPASPELQPPGDPAAPQQTADICGHGCI
jgi:hypothetical protein